MVQEYYPVIPFNFWKAAIRTSGWYILYMIPQVCNVNPQSEALLFTLRWPHSSRLTLISHRGPHRRHDLGHVFCLCAGSQASDRKQVLGLL